MGHAENSFYCLVYAGGYFGVWRGRVGGALRTSREGVLCRICGSLCWTSGGDTKQGTEDRIDMAATGSVLCCVQVSVYTAPRRANGASAMTSWTLFTGYRHIVLVRQQVGA
jgi:hypothetical protein